MRWWPTWEGYYRLLRDQTLGSMAILGLLTLVGHPLGFRTALDVCLIFGALLALYFELRRRARGESP